jgi:predicted site-specific integrase-resolvase
MRSKFPTAEIIKDYGSGINFKRKGLQTLLERVMLGDKLRIIVAHRDRLARFGGEIIQFLVEQNGGEVVVLDKTVYSPEEELRADLLAILHVFSCRMHGLRRYRDQIKEDRNFSHSGTESDPS